MTTKQIAWNIGSGNITLTYQGQGDGTITVSSDPNNLGSARSQVINIKTTAGSPVITRELTVSQAACPFPVGDVRNFAYIGSYQEVELPAGQYKLQCWGAQGGSNAADSSYGITSMVGGKGGYSEGIITLTQKTIVRVYVGGAGSSSAGGYNGGGSTTGSSTYNSGDEQGVSRMGGGGGATDIRLSDGALLSRMIVAGGGSGGAMCYKAVTSTSWNTILTQNTSNWTRIVSAYPVVNRESSDILEAGETYKISIPGSPDRCFIHGYSGSEASGSVVINEQFTNGGTITIPSVSWGSIYIVAYYTLSSTTVLNEAITSWGGSVNKNKNIYSVVTKGKYYKITFPGSVNSVQMQYFVGSSAGTGVYAVDNYSNGAYIQIRNESGYQSLYCIGYYSSSPTSGNVTIMEMSDLPTGIATVQKQVSSPSTSNESQVGYVGGGINGGGYNSSYYGKQNGAGSNGTFGQGANQDTTNYRYCSGAGGGGWYGGGMNYSDSDMNACKMSGGGSGFVNTSANASYRPSGYTGLQLDSGTTYAGNVSFPSTSGGTETGHSGNGYARITRIA